MSVLDKIDKPSDLRLIKKELLPELANDIRKLMISTVSEIGGHLAPSLGTVELTIALHYVLNTPKDKIVWDVGHQAYPHKIITGRREQFKTLRQIDGISGFPRISESEYDAFGTGHSSTAISAALGFAVARDMNNEDYKVVAVVGDGAMTGGLAYEGLLNSGHSGTDMLVILNDNEMFISHRVGALAAYLTKLLTGGLYSRLYKRVERFLSRIHFWGSQIMRVAKRFRVLLFPGMLFEEMGFAYLGPIDGHDINKLIEILTKVKDLKGPVLLHVITKKGKGYEPAEENATAFHGVGKFNVITGEPLSEPKYPTYTKIFSQTLVKLAEMDSKVVAITAAMADGTGLTNFQKEFPKRFFDVGIAEGHAVNFAAGLARAGYKPVVALYSTFLQRAIDEIIHDVCLQNLPVIFAIDRAGIVGEDGATHQGAFDLTFLRMIPNIVVMAPSNENELQNMLATAVNLNKPVAIRYPRGEGIGVKLDIEPQILEIGKSKLIMEGKDVYIFAVGNMVNSALKVSEKFKAEDISCGIVDARFIKPLDVNLIKEIARKVKKIVTIEENVISGGYGSAVCELLKDEDVKIKIIGLPDKFIEHGKQSDIRKKYGLTEDTIYSNIKEWLKKSD
ncbi:MAG: 1-deoxy-D-xylulose-5-phosphate synthase [Elusimicrobia bacterium RIFOXYC2_FULL_34_12]|nr:MAG: 1-deoxy-D-xylulose-5-phosphate synthase [Elusimicrobia bacterium RIFOXYC2_FULL_34_12]OGS46798.1 MAG: 1-deoxy-D-xylulose-5-phosphate synthase [Elusimicrobia bacterium RIFOXYD2_FULL_34_15]HAM39738.1 1-deoxy-D-xylulose-5-phosphate synthase [Elusimicrobiota bacterium]